MWEVRMEEMVCVYFSIPASGMEWLALRHFRPQGSLLITGYMTVLRVPECPHHVMFLNGSGMCENVVDQNLNHSTTICQMLTYRLWLTLFEE